VDTTSSDFGLFQRIRGKIRYHVKPILDAFDLIYYRIFKSGKFIFNKIEFPYFYALHNETFKNERAVEVPIAMNYVAKYSGRRVLEVGNVLSHYFNFSHTIIDKYEKGNSILNFDITEYRSNDKYDLIITISTLEHVGWDEYARYGNNTTANHKDPELLLTAISNLKRILNKNGTIIATMPLGFNIYLDSLIESQKTGFSEVYFLKRISKDNKWIQVPYAEVKGAKYSDPYPCANGVIIGIYNTN
jgi:hypothetical protein